MEASSDTNYIPPNGITIALMGATGTGKSTFANLASGTWDLQVADNLKSCTTTVEHTKPFYLDGVPVTLIDTPGFDDSVVSDSDILKSIASYLAASFEKGFKLSGVIYMHRISDYKMGGISRRNFSMFRKLCGDQNLKNVMIVTNMWAEVSPAVGEARELELMTDDLLFKAAYEKGAGFMRHDNTAESAHRIIRRIIKNHPEALRIQQELVEEKKDIIDVEAFGVLDRDMERLRMKHKEQLQTLQRQLDLALENKDAETQEELRSVRLEMVNKVVAMNKKHDALSQEYREEKKKADAKIQELVLAIQDERKRAAENQSRFEEIDAERRRENQQMLNTLRLMQDRLEQQAAQAQRDREHQQELDRRERAHQQELERIRQENDRLKFEQLLAQQQRMEKRVYRDEYQDRAHSGVGWQASDSDGSLYASEATEGKRKVGKRGFLKRIFG